MSVDLSVVIPAYNESKRIGRTISMIQAHYGGNGTKLEIVLADDGSRDDTAAVVRSLVIPPVRLCIDRSEQNKGKGAAVRRGMLAATGRLRLFMDADLSVPLEEFAKFMPRFESGDQVVIGSRRMPGAQLIKRQPALREALGTCFRALARCVVVPGITDFTCGFKCFTAEAAEMVFRRARIDGWSYDAEILYIAHRLGFRIAEVPVRWINDPDTKVRLSRDILGSLSGLAAIRLNAIRGLYDDRE